MTNEKLFNGLEQYRIAVLLAGLNVAGIQRIRIALIQEFVRLGIKVDIFCRDDEGPLRSEIPDGVRVFAGGRLGYLGGLFKYITNEKPTHVLSSYEDITLMAIAAIRVSRHKPFLLSSTHNSLTDVQGEGGVVRRLKYKLLVLLMRRGYKRVDACVAVSGQLADDLSDITRISSSKISIIYNPVTPRKVANSELSVVLPEGSAIIGFFGRLHHQKRVDLLIRAFARLAPEFDSRLCIFGDGKDKGALQALAKKLLIDERIEFYASSSNPYPAMEKCAVVVLPSDYEGFGNVLIEAMACGTQVISTDCRFGPAEILEGGRWGQLVPCNDVQALADALGRSLSGEFHVPSADLRGRASAFTLKRTAKAYLDKLGIPTRAGNWN